MVGVCLMNTGFPLESEHIVEPDVMVVTQCNDCNKYHQTVQVKMVNFMSPLFGHIKENQMHVFKEKIFNCDQILKRLRSYGLIQHFHEVQREGDPWKVTWAGGRAQPPAHLPDMHSAFLCSLIPLEPPSQVTHKLCNSTDFKGLPEAG